MSPDALHGTVIPDDARFPDETIWARGGYLPYLALQVD